MNTGTKILGVVALILLLSGFKRRGKGGGDDVDLPDAYINVQPNWGTGTLTYEMGIVGQGGAVLETKSGSAYINAGYGDAIDIAFTGTRAVWAIANDTQRVMLTVLCCLPQQYILARKIVDFSAQTIINME